MSIALPTALQAVIQQNWLQAEFIKALFPVQMFRAVAAERIEWPGHLGEIRIMTGDGLLPIDTRPATPGVDPLPEAAPNVEQWTVAPQPYNKTMDTHLPTSYVTMDSLFVRNMINQARQAGRTLDHLVRNRLYDSYLRGNTYVTATSVASTSLVVANLNGLRTTSPSNGTPQPVSVASPLNITVNGVANTVVGATPASALDPDGPGTLTLGTAISAAIGHAVLANNRPIVVRVGGATTSNGIAAANTFNFAAIQQAVARLRAQNVPTMSDGTYHCHMGSVSEYQLMQDTQFTNVLRGNIDDVAWKNMIISRALGVTFFRNEETPLSTTTNANDKIHADLSVPIGVNAGVTIHRPVLYGAGAIKEYNLPVQGWLGEAPDMDEHTRVSEFGDTAGGGMGAVLDGIAYFIRPPLGRVPDMVSTTWHFQGDWGIPSNINSGDGAMFKRAVVIEHAG